MWKNEQRCFVNNLSTNNHKKKQFKKQIERFDNFLNTVKLQLQTHLGLFNFQIKLISIESDQLQIEKNRVEKLLRKKKEIIQFCSLSVHK